MAGFNRKVEQQANTAQRAAQNNARQSTDDSMMSAYMRRMFGIGARSPARNTAETWGRAAQTFLLPLIMQGAQTWKENYDARGDFKAGGRDYLDMMLRGEQLNPYQQSVLDNYQKKYPEEYAAALQAARGAMQQQTPAAQGATMPPPPEGINREGLFGALNANTRPPTYGEADISSPYALTGESLANSAPSVQDLLAEMFRQEELKRALNPNNQVFFERR